MIDHKTQPNGLHEVSFGGLKVPNVVFLSTHGSHLYGTNTPTSDTDYKGVYMANKADVILGTAKETYNASSGTKDSHNTEEDIDLELIELRKFMYDLSKSQTYAIELLFSNEGSVEINTEIFRSLRDNSDDLLTSNMMSFVGYCVSQSKKYGLKGKRLKDTERAYEFLSKQEPKSSLEDVLGAFERLVGYNENISLVEKTFEGQDREAHLLEINGKQFDLAVPVERVLPPLKKLINKYGNRARKAKDGVDWKAVSHAFRVAWQMEEIVKTGALKFPLRKAPEILRYKKGEVSYEDMQDHLSKTVEKIRHLEKSMENKEWDSERWNQWIVNTYEKVWK